MAEESVLSVVVGGLFSTGAGVFVSVVVCGLAVGVFVSVGLVVGVVVVVCGFVVGVFDLRVGI